MLVLVAGLPAMPALTLTLPAVLLNSIELSPAATVNGLPGTGTPPTLTLYVPGVRPTISQSPGPLKFTGNEVIVEWSIPLLLKSTTAVDFAPLA